MLKAGPRFGVSSVKTGPSPVLQTGPIFFCCFFPIFIVFWGLFGACLKTQILSHCPKIVFFAKVGGCQNEVFEKKIAFFVFFLFDVGEIETEQKKTQNGKGPKNYKTSVFLRWSIHNCEK